jgi:hypothetical protein
MDPKKLPVVRSRSFKIAISLLLQTLLHHLLWCLGMHYCGQHQD